jgi:hypothetical protein
MEFQSHFKIRHGAGASGHHFEAAYRVFRGTYTPKEHAKKSARRMSSEKSGRQNGNE